MAYKCSECGSESERVSDVSRGPMGVADSAKYECPECGHREYMAVW